VCRDYWSVRSLVVAVSEQVLAAERERASERVVVRMVLVAVDLAA